MPRLKTLVVDDEPGIRSGINRILRNYSVGYPFLDEDFTFEIVESDNGIEALEIIKKSKPDIVLLDNKLPGMDGVDVLEHMNNLNLEIPVMMITSYASLEIAVKATKRGAYNFVPKPFTPQELKSATDNITKHLFLKRMTKKLHEEEKLIRFQFLSLLSHELKSPLNAVESYLKIMQYKQAGENISSYKEMIDRSVDRLKGMRNLITDLLDFTKYESGTKQRDLKNIDITEIAKRAIDTVEPLAKQKGVKIFIDYPKKLLYIADKTEIEIIFNNLMSNAVKYNKPAGKVNVVLKDHIDYISILVEDTGIGMTNEEIEKLFGEFVRIKNIKTKNISGSGLGLSITKKITELYNGEIKIASKPEEGSKFTLSLPRNINKTIKTSQL